MSHAIFAPSFSREADDIAVYIDEQFGENASDEFISNPMTVCTLIASFPGIGKTDHNYTTDLVGFPSSTTGFSIKPTIIRCNSFISSRAGATGVPFSFALFAP